MPVSRPAAAAARIMPAGTIFFGPNRSRPLLLTKLAAATTPAMKGRKASPAVSEENPRTFCR
jgi:hypothetical protein